MGRQIYYGWFVVAGLFLILTVSSGFGFYNLSVYMNVLATQTGFSVSELSVAVSLFFIVGGAAGIGVAALLERFDVRWVMGSGALLAGLALGGSGHVTELWQLYALYVLFGVGNSAVSIVTSTTLVNRWFPGVNRSVALSFASTGLSFGGVLLTPLSARLFNDFGVTQVMPGIGAAFFLLIVPVVILVLRPQSEARSVGGERIDLTTGWSYSAAIRSRFFILITLAYVFCMGSQVGGIAHLYNRAEGLVGYAVAAMAVQALSLLSIICRIAGGLLLTRISTRVFTLGNMLGQALGLLLIGRAESASAVLLGAGLFGATVGNLLMLHPLWLAEAFGVKAYARIFSFSNAITVLGVASGPVLLGLLFDFQDYRLAYQCAAGISLGGGVIMFLAGPTPAALVEMAAPETT